MLLGQKLSEELKYRERRRGVRINALIPVTVEWEPGRGKSHGHPLRAQGKTRVVNQYGCLLVLPQELKLDQRVCVVNRVNQRRNPAVIVWKGKRRFEGTEFGVELVDPQMDFWGLEW